MRHAMLLMLAALALPLALALPTRAGEPPGNKPWYVGFWKAVADEDGPLEETLEFTVDGRFRNFDAKCHASSYLPFHVHDDDVYVTSDIPDKGPIAIIFHPIMDRRMLTYTSQRTRHNATYAKVATSPCEAPAAPPSDGSLRGEAVG